MYGGSSWTVVRVDICLQCRHPQTCIVGLGRRDLEIQLYRLPPPRPHLVLLCVLIGFLQCCMDIEEKTRIWESGGKGVTGHRGVFSGFLSDLDSS